MAHVLPSNVRPEFAHLDADEMMLQIVVPDGVKKGDNINVAGPDGRIFAIKIPIGCKPGSKMNVIVKKPEPSEEVPERKLPPPIPPRPSKGPPSYEEAADDESTLPIATSVDTAPEPDNYQTNEEEEEEKKKKTRDPTDSRSVAAAAGAGTVGAVAGVVVLGAVTGPLVAGVVVGAAAIYGTTRDDGIGESVRYVGAKTVDAASYVKDKAEEHHVVDRAKAASSAVYKKGKEINEKYDITGKTKAAASATYSKAKEVNEEYDLTGKAARGAAAAASKAKEVNEKYDLTGKAATAGATAMMAGMSVFEKVKSATATRTSESEQN